MPNYNYLPTFKLRIQNIQEIIFPSPLLIISLVLPNAMAPLNKSNIRILLCVAVLLHLVVATQAIGVNYGTKGDNLPPPAQVAEFLRTKTIIDRVKLFDANPDILRAFANSGIAVTISVANDYIPTMAQQGGAQQWLGANVAPFVPATNIIRVLVGNEVLQFGPQNAIDNLVAAMRSLRQALDAAGFKNIQVTFLDFLYH